MSGPSDSIEARYLSSVYDVVRAIAKRECLVEIVE